MRRAVGRACECQGCWGREPCNGRFGATTTDDVPWEASRFPINSRMILSGRAMDSQSCWPALCLDFRLAPSFSTCVSRILASLILFQVILNGPPGTGATQVVNGQFFTNGLAIVNSPLPNQFVQLCAPAPPLSDTDIAQRQFNAGGTVSVSVDVSRHVFS